MIEESEVSQKPVGTCEWYDFIGQLADALSGMSGRALLVRHIPFFARTIGVSHY